MDVGGYFGRLRDVPVSSAKVSPLRRFVENMVHLVFYNAFSHLCEMPTNWLSTQGHILPQQVYFPPHRRFSSSGQHLLSYE